MKLNRFIMVTSAVLCSFALLDGCSDDGVYRVYISEAKTLQIKNFDLGEELREVFHTVVTASDCVIHSGKEVGGDVKVQLIVDEAKVQEYDSLCGTDYPLLPLDYYTLTTETVIPTRENSSADPVLIVNAQGKIRPFDSYLLSVTITSIEGAQADHIQQIVYHLLSSARDVWAMPLADYSAWQVIGVSLEGTSGEGSDNGHVIHVFDGLKGTFRHTQWKGNEPQPQYHIIVDMRQEVRILGFQYISRGHGKAWPQEMTMGISLDSSKWESAGIYSDLLAGAKEEFRSYFLGFRQTYYFRLTITVMCSGKWATTAAEINAIPTIK